MMFEKYINNEITLENLIFNLNSYNSDKIKMSGIVYTPKYISDYIINLIKPKINEKVLEPSLGHGIFIFSLLEYIEKSFKLNGEDLKKYFLNNVYGIDIEKKNIKEFKEIVVLFFKKRNISISINEMNNFIEGDTLKLYINKNNIFNKKYDIMIGNPPYIRNKNIDIEYLKFLRNNFNTCVKGNIDIYYAFIELSIKMSCRCSLITPNSWIYNKSAFELRYLIKNDLELLIDFKQEKIFNSADTYTSIFLLNSNNISDNINYKNSLKNKFISFSKSKLNNENWFFYDKIEINKNIKIIKIHTPIATLSDNIYLNHDLNNNLDLISFYKISKIKNEEEFISNDRNIIFPYKFLNNKFIIKEENELEEKTFDYLKSKKEILINRDKGKIDKYAKWYSYGRVQGLNNYKEDSFLIIIPGMINISFKFFSIDIRKIENKFLFSSGFIIEVDKNNKDILLNYLNSEIFKNILINEGKVWKGKNEDNNFYSLKSTQLKELFIIEK